MTNDQKIIYVGSCLAFHHVNLQDRTGGFLIPLDIELWSVLEWITKHNQAFENAYDPK